MTYSKSKRPQLNLLGGNNMSQFLAPIHQWLFNKIKIMESIEKSNYSN